MMNGMKTMLTVTARGVIALPVRLRKALGLSSNAKLIAETTPEGLLLRPAMPLPVEIYSAERLREFTEAEDELAVALNRKAETR